MKTLAFMKPFASMKALSVLTALFLVAVSARADVTLNAIFDDHMVLQRDIPVAVYGHAEPGEKVTVAFAGQSRSTIADGAGAWRVTLDALKACTTSATMIVTGNTTKTVEDVVVGDVWLCSGQSNMDFTPGAYGGPYDAAEFDVPLLRHFHCVNEPSMSPMTAVTAHRVTPADSGWLVCSKEFGNRFTAVGLYFGRTIQQETGVPIGLIKSAWNGTTIETWISPDGVAAVPELTPPRNLPAKPVISGSYPATWHCLYHGKIHPFTSFAIKGAIWYQGESNGGEGESYFQKQRALIGGWRKAWNQGDFPFYFVQLPAWQKPHDNPAGGDGWARFRMAQLKSLAIPNTGMAVAIDLADVGKPDDIHPKDKKSVGERLALWALARDYGRRNLVHSGPLYRGVTIEGGTIRVSFDSVGSGLMIATRKGGFEPLIEEPRGKLRRFAIAGEDQAWAWADAVIDGKTVVVSSPAVPQPVAVRYAYSMCPEGCNLYNIEGLPASPFRSDDWEKEP